MHGFEKAGFLDGLEGRLYYRFHDVEQSGHPQTDKLIVVLPPLLEELNRSRRFISQMSSASAARHVPVLMFDFYGTGDSEGELENASWALWTQDTAKVFEQIASQGFRHLTLFGLRAGALYVPFLLQNFRHLIESIVLMEPVLTGDSVTRDLIRTRMAASLFGTEGRESNSEIRYIMESNGGLDVSGYTISSALTGPLSRIIVDINDLSDLPVTVLRCRADHTPAANAQQSRLAKEPERAVNELTVCSPAFWRFHDCRVEQNSVQQVAECMTPEPLPEAGNGG